MNICSEQIKNLKFQNSKKRLHYLTPPSFRLVANKKKATCTWALLGLSGKKKSSFSRKRKKEEGARRRRTWGGTRNIEFETIENWTVYLDYNWDNSSGTLPECLCFVLFFVLFKLFRFVFFLLPGRHSETEQQLHSIYNPSCWKVPPVLILPSSFSI